MEFQSNKNSAQLLSIRIGLTINTERTRFHDRCRQPTKLMESIRLFYAPCKTAIEVNQIVYSLVLLFFYFAPIYYSAVFVWHMMQCESVSFFSSLTVSSSHMFNTYVDAPFVRCATEWIWRLSVVCMRALWCVYSASRGGEMISCFKWWLYALCEFFWLFLFRPQHVWSRQFHLLRMVC